MYNTLHPSTFYEVGLYMRLSQEDECKAHKRESESESIQNQRSLLVSYLKSNGFILIKEYVDDGYSGTNFDRPAFKEMVQDIENGKINCVITKDLSRLGRDYIKCGYYIEQYFPLKKVRFISILDNVDTFLDSANNDIAPFKALFNDMTSKDTSKKIRSILKNKKVEGKFIGSRPSFGYMRDPFDKGHLIPDPKTALIVKRIFNEVARGDKISDIINKFNEEKIPTPSNYKSIKNPTRQVNGNIWTCSSINKILKNRMYTGDMIQNVQAKLNYKSQKRVVLSSEYWIIVENTHEALVDREIFERIQNTPRRTRKTKKNRHKRVLEGLLFCKECGNSLTVGYRKARNYWSINCNRYSRSPRQHLCYPHFFEYNNFEKLILETVKKTCKMYIEKIDVKTIANNVAINEENKEEKLNNEKRQLNIKIVELQNKIDTIYEDKFSGIISSETYVRLSNESESLIRQCKNRLLEIETREEQKEAIVDISKYEEKIKKLLDLKKPSRELLFTLIEKIVVDKNKNVEIIYKFNRNTNIGVESKKKI